MGYMQQLLLGKKAIVTGATSGIGKEIALTFARYGASVAAWGTNSERAKEVEELLLACKITPEQQFIKEIIRVENKKEVEAATNALLEKWGSVDILVNNAGITRDGLLMKMTEEEWDQVIDTNLKSVYNLSQSLIRPMMKARSGKIINIASVVGLIGNPGQANYAASKAGMVGFTRALAIEAAARNIQVNCVAPGYIETRMTENLSEEQKKAILSLVPLGRMGKPSDIAEMVAFLASEKASYITGQVFVVDGGMIAR